VTTTSRGVVSGLVVEVRDHPNADAIRIAHVDINSGKLLQIVFGGPPNVTPGCLVPVAPPGSRVGPRQKKMRRRSYRNVSSEGMLCSFAELGWDEDGPDQVAILQGLSPGDPIDHFADGEWRTHVKPDYFQATRRKLLLPVLGPFLPDAFPAEYRGPKMRFTICTGGGFRLAQNA
jgi:tRNA-binding EMAP/Myf-like protein